MTREEWLERATDLLRPLFTEQSAVLPKCRASVGWPSARALSTKNRRIGECWSPLCSDEKITEIFISPCLNDAVQVLETLVHELVHAAVGVGEGHKGAFKQLAVAVGLAGPMRATHAGEGLRARLQLLACDLGAYPHARLNGSGNRKKQSTRLLKATCPNCGYTVRVTAKWAELALPVCGLCDIIFQLEQ